MKAPQDVETLIERIARGDRRAFRAFYGALAPRIHGVAARLMRDEAVAGDITQEVFTELWNSAGAWRGVALSPISWLIMLTRDACVARLRAARAVGRGPLPMDLVERLFDSRDLQTEGLSEEALALEACLSALPVDAADMIRAAYLQGMTYEELADDAGLRVEGVRDMVRLALVHVREGLSQ